MASRAENLDAASPSLVSGLFVVPLDSAGALTYYRSTLQSGHGLASRLLACAGSFAPLRGRRLRLRVSDRTDAERLLLSCLASRASTLGLSARFRCITMRDYEDSARNQAVAFVFDDRAKEPLVVAKLRLMSGEGASLRSEAESLNAVRQKVPLHLQASLPEVRDLVADDECEMLVLSALPGRSIYTQMQTTLAPSRHVSRHMLAAAAWLASFHEVTQTEGRAGGEPWSNRVPLTASHGDYWARNLLLDSTGAVGVVDWEAFSPSASPFIDLFHFPLTYGLNYPWTMYRRAAVETAFVKTFLEPTPISAAVRTYFAEYRRRTGMEARTLIPAFRSFLTSHGRMDRLTPGTTTQESLPWNRFQQLFDRATSSVFSG